MRLSKARKDILKNHQGLKPSKEALATLKRARQKVRHIIYTLIHEEPKRGNPKKDETLRRPRDKALRRARASVCFVAKYVRKSKYIPKSIITKRRRLA